MPDNREAFLEKLNIKKGEFEQALQRLINTQQEYHENLDGQTSMDELDQAQREVSVSSNYSLIERKAQELKKIERLIRQVIADSDFGICEECGNPIPPERLLIVPEATLCVPCQREMERMDRWKKLAGHKSLKLTTESVDEDEDHCPLNVFDQGLLDPDLEIIPLFALDEGEDSGASDDV